jgi:aspartate aminotransferase
MFTGNFEKQKFKIMPKIRKSSHFVNLNLNVRGLVQSATLLINERSNELIKKGVTVYKLGLGQSPFPVPDIIQEALRRNAHQKDYLPVK